MEPLQYFLSPRYKAGSLHQYRLRQKIAEHIRCTIKGCTGRIIDIGCGAQPYRSLVLMPTGPCTDYVGVDLSGIETPPDTVWDGWTLPFPDASFDVALCTEVLEHAPDPQRVIDESFRILKPKGLLIATTPFFWVLHEVPSDYQRLTPFQLRRMLKSAGFTEITITALGGFDASLAQMLGLWIELRPMKKVSRFLCQTFLGPIVWILNTIDRVPDATSRWTMFTGFAVTAKK